MNRKSNNFSTFLLIPTQLQPPAADFFMIHFQANAIFFAFFFFYYRITAYGLRETYNIFLKYNFALGPSLA